MAEYIGEENVKAGNESNERRKIKTPFAEIVVGGTVEKPCYSILWWDSQKGWTLGFSSYMLQYVKTWLNEEFEIIGETDDVDSVVRCRKCRHGIPCGTEVFCYHPAYKDDKGVEAHKPEFYCAYGETVAGGDGAPGGGAGDTGKKGAVGVCPNCGCVRGLKWESEEDTNTCDICGWTDAKERK